MINYPVYKDLSWMEESIGQELPVEILKAPVRMLHKSTFYLITSPDLGHAFPVLEIWFSMHMLIQFSPISTLFFCR